MWFQERTLILPLHFEGHSLDTYLKTEFNPHNNPMHAYLAVCPSKCNVICSLRVDRSTALTHECLVIFYMLYCNYHSIFFEKGLISSGGSEVSKPNITGRWNPTTSNA